jgi:hypothetical protein
METKKKAVIIYFYVNTIFLIPALLTGVGITFPAQTPALLTGVGITFSAQIFGFFYIFYFLFYGFIIHFQVLLVVLIYGIISAFECIKENKPPSVKLVLLYVTNVLVNIFGIYFGGSFLMSMK